jgi:hypothetical protein
MKGYLFIVTGKESIIKNAVDLSGLGITFSLKPLVIGGLAMEYYEYLNAHDGTINNGNYRTV